MNIDHTTSLTIYHGAKLHNISLRNCQVFLDTDLPLTPGAANVLEVLEAMDVELDKVAFEGCIFANRPMYANCMAAIALRKAGMNVPIPHRPRWL